MEHRTIGGIDEPSMRRRAQAYFAAMRAAYGERDYRRRPADALFPPSFPSM
jgi:hypothetical protein